MTEDAFAANPGAAAPEGVASPPEDNNSLAANAAPEGTVSPASSTPAPAPAPPVDPEQTITQTVARRLKEETEKFHSEETPKIKQAAVDEYIAAQRIEWPEGSGNYIKTEAELKAAREKQAVIDQYRAQGLPQAVIDQLTEVQDLKRWKQGIENQTAQQKAAQEAEAREISMYQQFLDDFPELKGKTADEYRKLVPKAVVDEAKKWLQTGGREGLPLTAAYERHLFRQGRQQQQTQQANAQNAASSTGSAKGNGTPQTHFTREQVEAMSVEEVAANLTAIKASRKLWK